MRFSQE